MSVRAARKIVLLEGAQEVAQGVDAQGLAEEVVHAGGVAGRDDLGGGRCGDGDDGDVAVGALLAAADLACGGVAVHEWHVDVHEDGVEGLGFEQAEGFDAVGCNDAGVAVEAEQAHGDELVDLVVLGDEDAQAGLGGGGGGGREGDGLGVPEAELDREGEAAALGGLALDRDGALHEGDQAGGDGQAEAGADARGACGAHLGEGLEDLWQLGGGDADAGVADVEAEDCVVGRPFDGAHVEGHGAARGCELDGVAEEVDEDLEQAIAIADEVGGDVGRDVVKEREALGLDAQGEHALDGGDAVCEGEADGVEIELSGLDAGEVEGVADDAHELLGGGASGGEVVCLLEVEAGAEEELDHADDAVHGRTQLVVHAGEELALGAVCALGLILAELEAGEEAGVLDGDGGLGCEHLDDVDACGGEDVPGEVVLEVDDAEQLGSSGDGCAEQGAWLVGAHVGILGVGLLGAGVAQDHALVGADHVPDGGLGEAGAVGLEIEGGQGAVAVLAGVALGLEGEDVTLYEQEVAALGARVLDDDLHELGQEGVEHELAGESLGGAHHGLDVDHLGGARG